MASMGSDRMTEFYPWYYGLAIAIGMYEWIAGWMQERWTDAGITLSGWMRFSFSVFEYTT